MRKLAVLSTLLLASTALAQQLPIPAFGSTFTSTLTRGFWFQAPVGFVITGLMVPNEQNQTNQVVEVINIGSAPPAYPGVVTGTQLFYDNTTPAGQIIPCAIPVAPGDFIGILGACNPSQGSATSVNSYATPAGPFQSSVFGIPTTLTRFGTQSGIASNGGNQPCWEEPAGQLSRVEVYIGGGSGFAQAAPIGAGCGNEYSSFYESMGAFDLSNTSLSMTFVGNGYVVLPGTAAIAPQPSAPIAMGDDQVIPFSLGWSMPYNGGTTNTIAVSSNGFVHFGNNTTNGCCAFTAALFFNGGSPCIAAKWRDLNPAAGGTVQFDTDPANGVAYVTFTGVPDYAATNTNDFQYVFYQSGTVELRYGNVAPTAGTVGYSGGINAADPGQTDLSAITVLVTGTTDRPALGHSTSGRPVIGSSITLTTSAVPAGAQVGATLFGLTELPFPIDLTPLGMPGCSQYGTVDASQIWIAAGNAGTTNFQLPSDPAFAGIVVITQGAVLAPGINAAGALSSRALRLTLDVN